METDNFENQLPEEKRPQLLTVLCILTFISTGFTILACLCIPLVADTMIGIMHQNPDFDAQKEASVIPLLKAGWGYYMVMLLFTVTALCGAIFMWKRRKLGFHLYALANIALFLLPTLWLPIPFSITGMILPAVFIALYALNLKFMK